MFLSNKSPSKTKLSQVRPRFSVYIFIFKLYYMTNTVKTCDKAIYCDLCSKCIHIKCNNLNDLDYLYLKSNDET